MRALAEDVLAGRHGRFLQHAAWMAASLHPVLRAARFAQRGEISSPLRILRRSAGDGRRSGLARHLYARLEDMARFLDTPRESPGARHPCADFNGRVLYALHSIGHFHPNGYASRSIALIRALRERGIVPVVTARPGYPWDLADCRTVERRQEVEHEGVRCHLAPDAEKTVNAPESEYIASYAAYLQKLARAHEASVVHAASNYLNGAAAAAAGRALGLRSIYEVRGLWHLTRAFAEPGYGDSEHFRYCEARELAACTDVDHVIAISSGLRDWLVVRGVPGEKISIVGNAASGNGAMPKPSGAGAQVRGDLGIPTGAQVLGYLGSMVEYEGLDRLLRAQARTPAPRRPYLLLVGGGRQERHLRRLARRLGIESRVVFAGRVGSGEVPGYYAAMDALVLPRRDDPLTRLVPPIKPFEVAAEGKPLFVSPPLAEALGGELESRYTVVDIDALDRLDHLLDDSPGMRPAAAVPTWGDRADQVIAIYRRGG